jgi:hypothetical protein
VLLANQGLNPDPPRLARALGLPDSSGSFLCVESPRIALAARAIFSQQDRKIGRASKGEHFGVSKRQTPLAVDSDPNDVVRLATPKPSDLPIFL